MKYAVEMASGGVIYIPSFIKIGLCILNLLRWGYIYEYKYTAAT
jgi:hypothetical protein